MNHGTVIVLMHQDQQSALSLIIFIIEMTAQQPSEESNVIARGSIRMIGIQLEATSKTLTMATRN
jgi:hypothetical protein